MLKIAINLILINHVRFLVMLAKTIAVNKVNILVYQYTNNFVIPYIDRVSAIYLRDGSGYQNG